jgi:hypothetical protein
VESLAEITTTAVPEHQQQQRVVVVVEVNSLVDFPALRPQDNSNSTSPPAAAGQSSSGSCVDPDPAFCFFADPDSAFHFLCESGSSQASIVSVHDSILNL